MAGKDKDKPEGSSAVDEAYKTATQSVVDDRMRIDVLGPKFCDVLEQHKPATEALHAIIKKAINEPEIKTEIHNVIDQHDKNRKAKWVDRAIGAVSGVIGAVIVGVIVWWITKG